MNIQTCSNIVSLVDKDLQQLIQVQNPNCEPSVRAEGIISDATAAILALRKLLEKFRIRESARGKKIGLRGRLKGGMSDESNFQMGMIALQDHHLAIKNELAGLRDWEGRKSFQDPPVIPEITFEHLDLIPTRPVRRDDNSGDLESEILDSKSGLLCSVVEVKCATPILEDLPTYRSMNIARSVSYSSSYRYEIGLEDASQALMRRSSLDSRDGDGVEGVLQTPRLSLGSSRSSEIGMETLPHKPFSLGSGHTSVSPLQTPSPLTPQTSLELQNSAAALGSLQVRPVPRKRTSYPWSPDEIGVMMRGEDKEIIMEDQGNNEDEDLDPEMAFYAELRAQGEAKARRRKSPR